MTTILTTTGISLYINAGREYDTKTPVDEQMREYLYKDPASASAEANSLLKMAQPNDTIVLLHTDTILAERCANLVQEFFIVGKGFKQYQVQVKKLQLRDDEQHIETHGLRNLVNEINRILSIDQDVVISEAKNTNDGTRTRPNVESC